MSPFVSGYFAPPLTWRERGLAVLVGLILVVWVSFLICAVMWVTQ